MPPKIIGLVGPIRAGKSTAAQILSEQYGYSIASNSALLSAILRNMDIDPTRANLSKLGDSMFKVLGNEIIARFRLAHLASGPIIIDGIRYHEEIAVYSTEPSFKLIGIIANEQTRFDRALTDNSMKDSNIERSAFSQLSNARSEREVLSLLKKCDFIIKNSGSKENYEAQLHKLIRELT